MNNNTSENSALFSNRLVKIFLISIFILLTVSSFKLIPYSDSYYYWDWSRHLALSYYDGPPMIAYLMRAFTSLFGNTIFAINFLGVVTIFGTLFFIYKTGELFAGKQVGLNAGLLWILATPVLYYLFIRVTYDNPLNLCWAATIYFVVHYIYHRNNADLYCIGATIGLMLLSKYTGVILILGLVLFVVSLPQYRQLLRNPHLYFAMFLGALIFSPVIIWNYQHDWISIKYQLTAHQNEFSAHEGMSKYLFKIVTFFNFILFIPLFGLFKSRKQTKSDDALVLLNFITFTFLFFLLYLSTHSNIAKNWLTPFCISAALLTSYYLAQFNLRKLLVFVVVLYALWDVYYLASYTIFNQQVDEDIFNYNLAKEAGQKYYKPQTVFVTSSWMAGSLITFWLPQAAALYSLPCGAENQYGIWSRDLLEKVKTGEIKEVIYLDQKNNSSCIKQYFQHCEQLPMLKYQNDFFRVDRSKSHVALQLFAYQCLGHRVSK